MKDFIIPYAMLQGIALATLIAFVTKYISDGYIFLGMILCGAIIGIFLGLYYKSNEKYRDILINGYPPNPYDDDDYLKIYIGCLDGLSDVEGWHRIDIPFKILYIPNFISDMDIWLRGNIHNGDVRWTDSRIYQHRTYYIQHELDAMVFKLKYL